MVMLLTLLGRLDQHVLVTRSGHSQGSRLFFWGNGHDAFVTSSGDPDLRHLADLLDFLPGPDDPHFWENLPCEPRTHYVLEKLVPKIPILRDPNPPPVELAYLAKYLMYFFKADTPEMLDHVGRQTDLPMYELAGHHWLGDLQATCWRLYVRYRHPGKNRLEAWPDDFHEWHSQRRESAHD